MFLFCQVFSGSHSAKWLFAECPIESTRQIVRHSQNSRFPGSDSSLQSVGLHFSKEILELNYLIRQQEEIDYHVKSITDYNVRKKGTIKYRSINI